MNSQNLGGILDMVSSLQKTTSKSAKESKDASKGVADLELQIGDIEDRLKVIDACGRNSRVFKPYHGLAKVKVLVRGPPDSKGRKGPMTWMAHPEFPRTVAQFKELQYHAKIVRDMLDFYNIPVYCDDGDGEDVEPRRVDIRASDKCRDVSDFMSACMEALAIAWGLDWQKIGGMAPLMKKAPMPSSAGGGGPRGGGGGARSRAQSYAGSEDDYPPPRDRDRDRDRDRSR